MRLIDADKLEAYGATVPKGCNVEDYLCGAREVLEYIDSMPTVDAIPIEWVNKWIKEHESWGWGEATFTSSVEIMVSDFLRERSNNYLLPGFTVTPNAERKEE